MSFASAFALPIAHAASGIGIPSDLYPEGMPTAGGKLPTGAVKETAEGIRTALTSHLVEVILGIAATVALFFILNDGFWMIASAGGEKVEHAKKGLMWAIIGLVLIILSYSIIRFVILIPSGADERTISPTTDSATK